MGIIFMCQNNSGDSVLSIFLPNNIFVSMATELSDRQRFYKNTAISKQNILQTEIWIIYTYSGKSPSV